MGGSRGGGGGFTEVATPQGRSQDLEEGEAE